MLLVIDVGNTNIVMGVYDGEVLVRDWRIHTQRNTTADEFSVVAGSLLAAGDIDPQDIERTVISCVVPPLVPSLDAFCRKYLGHAPFWVDPRTFTGIVIDTLNPAEVGADRIVNAVGAYRRYGRSLIVIDFGTATTFDAISSEGAYLGGAISPGIMIAAEALFQKASKLPRVEIFQPPPAVVGRDTHASIQSGIIFGYAGLVDGMVRRMQAEMGGNPGVIATGGLAGLMQRVSETIEAVEPDLTLEGLRIIAAEMLD